MEKKELQELQKKITSVSRLSMITMALLVIFSGAIFYTVVSTPRSGDRTQELVPSQESRLKKLLSPPEQDSLFGDGESGRIVKRADLKSCFDAYDELMLRHGFKKERFTTGITVFDTSSIITKWEAFRGKELFEFLDSAAKRHGEHVKVTVRVRLGVYTREYLEKYHQGANAQAAINRKLGRIAIFLVTKSRSAENLAPTDDEEDGDDNSFDLGEINPPREG